MLLLTGAIAEMRFIINSRNEPSRQRYEMWNQFLK